jgi:hypothetical protein
MKGFIKPLLAFAISTVFAAEGLAESHTIKPSSNEPSRASARIKLRVIIPEILLFQLGDATAGGITLALPATTGVPAAHLNSGHAVITTSSETASEITYTSASL